MAIQCGNVKVDKCRRQAPPKSLLGAATGQRHELPIRLTRVREQSQFWEVVTPPSQHEPFLLLASCLLPALFTLARQGRAGQGKTHTRRARGSSAPGPHLTQLGHPPPPTNSRGWLSHVFPPGRNASPISPPRGPRLGQGQANPRGHRCPLQHTTRGSPPATPGRRSPTCMIVYMYLPPRSPPHTHSLSLLSYHG